MIYIESLDESEFIKLLTKYYQGLYSLEIKKHMPPKYSCALNDLISYYGITPEIDSSFDYETKVINKSASEIPQIKNNSQKPLSPYVWYLY